MITIPAMHTGKAYGIINQYKQDEKWLDDGSFKSCCERSRQGIVIVL